MGGMHSGKEKAQDGSGQEAPPMPSAVWCEQCCWHGQEAGAELPNPPGRDVRHSRNTRIHSLKRSAQLQEGWLFHTRVRPLCGGLLQWGRPSFASACSSSTATVRRLRVDCVVCSDFALSSAVFLSFEVSFADTFSRLSI